MVKPRRYIEGLECPACGENSLIYRRWPGNEEVYCFEEMGCGEFMAEYSGDTEGRILTIMGIEPND